MKAIEIRQETNYWLIRAGVGTKFFEEFYRDSCVAIGWDRIGKIGDENGMMSIEELKYLVEIEYQDLLSKKESGKECRRKVSEIAAKIYRFTYEVKEGDIVITPGDDSVLIGRVVGDVYIENNKYISKPESLEEQYIGELNKIRRVVWIKKIDKEKLEPNIKLELRVVHGLSKISNKQVITEINRTIYSYYTYNDETHSVYRIKNQRDIDFEKYAKFISCIYDIYSEIRSENDSLYIKSNINSPGPIELFGKATLVERITMIMQIAFKSGELYRQDVVSEQPIIDKIRDKYKDTDYDDFVFPKGGQA